MNFEVGGVPPKIDHLADFVMALGLEYEDVAGVGAQAAEYTDSLETPRLSPAVPPFARFFDYLRAACGQSRLNLEEGDVQHFPSPFRRDWLNQLTPVRCILQKGKSAPGNRPNGWSRDLLIRDEPAAHQ